MSPVSTSIAPSCGRGRHRKPGRSAPRPGLSPARSHITETRKVVTRKPYVFHDPMFGCYCQHPTLRQSRTWATARPEHPRVCLDHHPMARSGIARTCAAPEDGPRVGEMQDMAKPTRPLRPQSLRSQTSQPHQRTQGSGPWRGAGWFSCRRNDRCDAVERVWHAYVTPICCTDEAKHRADTSQYSVATANRCSTGSRTSCLKVARKRHSIPCEPLQFCLPRPHVPARACRSSSL